MAEKEIVWSLRAQQDRIQILEYWINRNKSKTYSKKLYRLFNSAIELVSAHPEIGKPTSRPGIRAKIVRNYLIIYQIREKYIDILTIWDSRQNPKKLESLLSKQE